jgi:hypothetical protein
MCEFSSEKCPLFGSEKIGDAFENTLENGDALRKQHSSIKSGRKCAGLRAVTAAEVSGQDQRRSSARRCRKSRQHVRQSAHPGTAVRAFGNERRSMPMNTFEGI